MLLITSHITADFTDQWCTVSSPLVHVFNLFEARDLVRIILSDLTFNGGKPSLQDAIEC